MTVEARGLLPVSIFSDGMRLRQVLLNLLSNAAKFTQSGAVRVVLACSRSQELYTIEIHDSGIGIDPARLESMFESFVQADASITRRFGGTGLGLAISRQFCRLMGGDLTVTSEEGRGSTFTVELPTRVTET